MGETNILYIFLLVPVCILIVLHWHNLRVIVNKLGILLCHDNRISLGNGVRKTAGFENYINFN